MHPALITGVHPYGYHLRERICDARGKLNAGSDGTDLICLGVQRPPASPSSIHGPTPRLVLPAVRSQVAFMG